ncbi:unnamed protein product, partial [Aureobasidium uvarum]
MRRPLLLLFICNLVAALPLHLPGFGDQKPLLSVRHHHAALPSIQVLDRIPRSAELLFTASDDDEMIHIWLPLEKRIYTRDYPVLPLHPASARIINVLGISAKISARHKQQQVTCIIKAGANRSQFQTPTELDVVFREGDGGLRLDEADSPLCLKGREVESYECF